MAGQKNGLYGYDRRGATPPVLGFPFPGYFGGMGLPNCGSGADRTGSFAYIENGPNLQLGAAGNMFLAGAISFVGLIVVMNLKNRTRNPRKCKAVFLPQLLGVHNKIVERPCMGTLLFLDKTAFLVEMQMLVNFAHISDAVSYSLNKLFPLLEPGIDNSIKKY